MYILCLVCPSIWTVLTLLILSVKFSSNICILVAFKSFYVLLTFSQPKRWADISSSILWILNQQDLHQFGSSLSRNLDLNEVSRTKKVMLYARFVCSIIWNCNIVYCLCIVIVYFTCNDKQNPNLFDLEGSRL